MNCPTKLNFLSADSQNHYNIQFIDWLCHCIWKKYEDSENDYFLGRSLDVFITKIRKYLKDDASISIENVFGVGFIFNAPQATIS